ncbi:MAG: NVEALA domain-containing protein [Tannerellaceae bacterium]|jgi:hypothetical protein|nr:NVEALA domain-containing protein [Tannerellaceae bacterium]
MLYKISNHRYDILSCLNISFLLHDFWKRINNSRVFLRAIIITVALAGWNISKNNSEKGLSDVALANVEALANDNPDCPNGCKSCGNGCYCHTWYPCLKEAHW